MKYAFYPNPWPETVEQLADEGFELVHDLGAADFLIYNGGPHDVPDLPDNIQFVQFAFTGVEKLAAAGVFDGSVRWANTAGVYATPVAEIAVTLLLSAMHEVKAASVEEAFANRWELDARQQWLFGLTGRKTVAIVGAGGIGQEIMRMLSPFGCRFVAVNRSGNPVEGAERTVRQADAAELWPQTDIVINSLPLTEETRGFMDASFFAALPDHAIVINVGRGETVDTEALVQALRTKQIAAAGMDVTDPEPLPSGHPLYALPNAIITPHIAATGRVAKHLLAPQVVENARACAHGEKMPTEIDVKAGY
ncbi:D-isomer specific 2-hydroxyacid dehydrogenase family protein [Corynebacterium renale]|uniref:Phosphoglycerate dehydrogenase-like enzyme n=1 Tax=Corynebacterium renale TaxID=1724 RepID=A0A2A9DPE4_9CORY|nr:D-isomer specific 2-hydroxyacid dehydrogenase family protein [Corynebacterium renale]PFG28226.1 phosphoglycerate dehydrogenase-like enzyme [Corynebacterium renale]SQI19679.1 phosphoglycerate dehydrogenase-related dehydrogenase [Corynebacterium renale]